ncbi:hypothetical protein HPB50_018647 [Hyalomma asiaticum]|uniref:Uncharacterized protein n=1 Tax=Hyalomma asiaticum TaxID=266040 RepID=A0ACB7SZL3_HYAAI|nr:hypothetical protein HPB50_018647 [Hyalomma asiaticum]
MPLENLAELADRIAEYSCGGSTVAATAAMTPDTEWRHSRLEEKIEELSASTTAISTSAEAIPTETHVPVLVRAQEAMRMSTAGITYASSRAPRSVESPVTGRKTLARVANRDELLA